MGLDVTVHTIVYKNHSLTARGHNELFDGLLLYAILGAHKLHLEDFSTFPTFGQQGLPKPLVEPCISTLAIADSGAGDRH